MEADFHGNAGHIKGAGRSDPARDLKSPEIAEHFPVSGASISRHLSVLKDADLIRDQREGKYIFYELNVSVLEEIMLWITDLTGESSRVMKLGTAKEE